VKTAISIPDETFQRAELQAAELRMSRSEFITRAIRRYLTELEAEALTRRIDSAIDIAWPRDVEVGYVQHGEHAGEKPW
jgi:metal-responsive CopG/Arc/MetJ family transcriptional regulator